MKFYKEKAKHLINPDTEIHYATQTTYKYAKFPHIHDFYELLLIIKGTQLLTVNERNLFLKESTLILIRPTDIHSKKYIDEGIHINLAFPKKTANELFNYLGAGFPKETLINSPIPPYVILTNTEKAIIQNRFENLNLEAAADTRTLRTHLRILLFELFIKYFSNQAQENENMPAWLTTVLSEMKKKENFTSGLPTLLAIADKNHAYLCRSFKKYLNVTPITFINELRLNYAVNLLLHSDRPILDICLEAGFDNLSHFYHIFKKTFHTTPSEYRNAHISADLL